MRRAAGSHACCDLCATAGMPNRALVATCFISLNSQRGRARARWRPGHPHLIAHPVCLSQVLRYIPSRILSLQSHPPTLAPCHPPRPLIVNNPALLLRVLCPLIHPYFLESFAPTMLLPVLRPSLLALLGQMSRASPLSRILPPVLDDLVQVR